KERGGRACPSGGGGPPSQPGARSVAALRRRRPSARECESKIRKQASFESEERSEACELERLERELNQGRVQIRAAQPKQIAVDRAGATAPRSINAFASIAF